MVPGIGIGSIKQDDRSFRCLLPQSRAFSFDPLCLAQVTFQGVGVGLNLTDLGSIPSCTGKSAVEDADMKLSFAEGDYLKAFAGSGVFTLEEEVRVFGRGLCGVDPNRTTF